MQEITDLERRITAALERIGRGIGGLSQRATPPAIQDDADDGTELAFGQDELQSALDEERMANAQLNERIRTLRDKEAADRQKAGEALQALQNELQDQHTENGILRQQIDNLEQELAAIRAERRAEAEQITDIVAALNPLIEEARHA